MVFSIRTLSWMGACVAINMTACIASTDETNAADTAGDADVASTTLGVTVQAQAAKPPPAWEPFAFYFVRLDEADGRVSRWWNGDAAYGEYWAPNFDNQVDLHGGVQGSPAAALDNAGRAHVFVVATNNVVYVKWETAAAHPWSFTTSWYSLGGYCVSNPAAFRNNVTHEMELFCLGANGAVYEKWQTSPGGGWSDWTSLGGNGISRMVAGNYHSSGGAFVQVYGTDGRLYVNTRLTSTSGWDGWRPG
jgi:hypothetical protein